MQNSNTKIQTFKDLLVWQKSHKIVLEIYKVTKKFPSDEKFGLVNQIRRAAVSVTSNIAEGFGRNSSKDKQHFYCISKGSLMEIQSQLLIALDLEYFSKKEHDEIEKNIIEVLKMLAGLIRSSVDRLNTNTKY